MTDIIIEGAQSYILPLESIDLSHLSKYVQYPRAEKIPLWSKRRLDGESEYYEVKIVAQDVNEDCYFEEPSDTYKCHICNVHVPIMCSKEHNESGKHVTLKNIFDQVLERVSKQINNSITINCDKQIDKDTYYCVPCSKIVKIENKYKHKSSNYHIKSQEDINCVNEFYKIFKRNNSNDDDRTVANEKHFDNDSLSTNNSSAEDFLNETAMNTEKDVTNNYKSTNDDTETVSTKNHGMKPYLTVESSESNDDREKKLSFEEYLKEIVKIYKLKVNLPFIDGDFIHIVNPTGLKVKVSCEQFHSYRQFAHNIYCQICDELIIIDSYVEQKKHEMSEIHARNILKPVNEEFVRTVDDTASHCMICNEIVFADSEEHHLSKTHIKLLNNTKLTETCQNNDDVKFSMNNRTNIGYTNTSDENKIIKINDTEYFCDVCKLILSENKLNDHINDSNHVARLSEATSVQKLVFCKLCNVNIPADKLEYHNSGTPHWCNAFNKFFTVLPESLQTFFSHNNTEMDSVASENKKDTIKNDNVASTSVRGVPKYKADPSRPFRIAADRTKNIVTCLICDIDIENNENLVTEHEKSKNHNKSVQSLLYYHSIIEKTPNSYFCNCCHIKVTSFFNHIGQQKHTALLQIKFSLNKRLLNLYTYIDNVRNSEAIMYRELYKKVLFVHKINKVTNSQFYCTICELQLPAGNLMHHVLSSRHTKWLNSIFK